MSAPAPLDHVADPDWLGLTLAATAGTDTSAADALATSADFGSLASEEPVSSALKEIGLDNIANFYGGAGAAIAQYQKSFLDEAYLYGGSSGVREAGRVLEAGIAGITDTKLGNVVIGGMGALIPIFDTLVVKPAAWLLDVNFSIGETLASIPRAIGAQTNRRDQARLRARTEMGGMGSAPRAGLVVAREGLAEWARGVVKHFRGLH